MSAPPAPPAYRRRERPPPPPRPRRVPLPVVRVALLAAAFAVAAVACHLLVHELTDDTYAFLDWGRDLRHGLIPPPLEGRTFHPLPLMVAMLLSLLGSAAPSATILCAVAGLVLLSVAAWQVSRLLGLREPAPTLSALLVLTSPMLVAISFGAYINLPFAVLIMWALVWELRGRRRVAWGLLVAAGLVRPEGWAFLVAYGAVEWWRAGHPLLSWRVPLLALLALGPMLLWLTLEWRLFGSPVYSLTNTSAPADAVARSTSAGGLWTTLQFSLALPGLIAAVVGAVTIVLWSPRRAAATVLATTVVAAATVAVLATSKFNIPDRHLSAFVSLVCVLAGAGACAPARWLLRSRPRWHLPGFGLGVAGAAIVIALGAGPVYQKLQFDFDVFSVERATGGSLDWTVAHMRSHVNIADAGVHSVAIVAAVDDSELVWDLGVPYNVVSDGISATTKLLVQPAPKTWKALHHRGLTDRALVPIPRRWTNVTGGGWRVWTPHARRPVPLR